MLPQRCPCLIPGTCDARDLADGIETPEGEVGLDYPVRPQLPCITRVFLREKQEARVNSRRCGDTSQRLNGSGKGPRSGECRGLYRLQNFSF